jgi:putative flippase GtrA
MSPYEHMRTAAPVRGSLGSSFVQRALSLARGDRLVAKFVRYSMVSAVSVLLGLTTIFICAWLFGLSGITANTIGVVVSTPVSYELNRKWAWRKGGKSHFWREVVPFWVLTIVGWLASTGTVEIADRVCKSHGVTGLPRALAIVGASLVASGLVWIAKFFLFNRLIFATETEVGGAGALVGADGRDVVATGPTIGVEGEAAPGLVPVPPSTVVGSPLAQRDESGSIAAPGIQPLRPGQQLGDR